MEILKNTLQPLPIYASKADWYENKRRGNGACRHAVVPSGKMISFYVTTDYVRSQNVTVKMMHKGADTEAYDITDACTIEQIGSVGTMKSYYFRFSAMDFPFADGTYYLSIAWSPVRTFVSEVFVVRREERLLKATYSHSKQLQLQDGRVMMFDNTTRRPLELWMVPEGGNVLTEWQTEEEVDGRDGFQMVEKRDMWKQHSITFLANEYTVDALMMMWVCDALTIAYDGEEYKVDYMESPTSTKVDTQNLREVTLTWRTDMVVQVNATVR